MKIIAIIVTYNGMKWYKNCFDSLRYSSIPIKAIVVDNKSSDETISFIKENYPEIHLIESDKNLGFGKANNIGIRYALEQDADYVFLLNQDAWVQPDTIEKLIGKMKDNPDYGILSPIHLDGSEQNLDFNFSYYILPDRCPDLISDYVTKGKAKDKIYPLKFVNAALWLISRKCIDSLGGFNPLFPHYGEDENYIERLEYHNLKIGLYPHVFGIHDRNRNEWRKPTFSKRKDKELIVSLLGLSNIHESFYKGIGRFIFSNISSSVKNLFRLSFNNLLINIIVFYQIIFWLPNIYKNRTLSKKKGLAFL